jgi:hypothetical protein
MSRRTLLGTATAAAILAVLPKAGARTQEWKPRLGILGKYTEANVDFAIQEGFNNMILSAGAGVQGLDTTKITDEDIGKIRNHLSSKAMHVSALQVNANHIAADPTERERQNSKFVKTIELAGRGARTSPPARWDSKRCSPPSRIPRTSACNTIRLISCGR